MDNFLMFGGKKFSLVEVVEPVAEVPTTTAVGASSEQGANISEEGKAQATEVAEPVVEGGAV